MHISAQRLKVLIIAHELSPAQGSECAVGWNITTRLAEFHDVTVIYATNSQANQNKAYLNAVQNHLKEHAINNIEFVNIDQPKITIAIAFINRIFKKLGPTGLPILYYIGYKYWHLSAFNIVKKLNAVKKFDLVHQLTQISFREPGYAWKLDIPFIWGPTGGTSLLPRQVFLNLPWQFKMLENIRKYTNAYQFNCVKRLQNANKRASVIYSFTNEDASRFKKTARGKVKIMLDVGTYVADSSPSQNSIIKGVWCGRLSAYKAPDILITALSLSEYTKKEIKFQMIGSGPLEVAMKKLALDLGVKNIEWISQVTHKEVFNLMREADFFVHTSLREATSSVIPEALSMGLPVICHDAYGMGIAINETCGIKIPFVSPDQSVKGFHKAIESLIIDKEKLAKLRQGAQQRALELSWDAMARTISSDYLAVANAVI